MSWHALHIFYYDRHDEFLKNGILQILKEMDIREYFFIRYWENGPHIRLRIKDIEDKLQALINQLNAYIDENPSKGSIDKKSYEILSEKYYEVEQISEKSPRIIDNNTIVEWRYIPEEKKYFGKKGVSLAEKEFVYSSNLALELLSASTKKEVKIYYGLAYMNLLMKYLTQKTKVQEFITFYRDYWIKFLDVNDDVLAGYDNEAERLPWNQEFYEKIRGAILKTGFEELHSELFLKIQELDGSTDWTIVSFIMNFIHLFNNRIGIVPVEEVRLVKIYLARWGEINGGL